MKKSLALILVLCICFGLCACQNSDYKKAQDAFAAGNYAEAQTLFQALGDYEDSPEMAKQSGYLLAREQMAAGNYAEAIESFRALGDYEDSVALIAECEVGQVDALLQGVWKCVQYEVIESESTFTNGRYTAKLTVGSSSLSNEGTYRIDNENKVIYVCYDYIIQSDGSKKPNSEEKELFTYSVENGVLTLIDNSDNVMNKQ